MVIVPAFSGRLRERPAMAATALEFAILTGSPVRRGAWRAMAGIDLDAKVWTIPARAHEGRERAPSAAFLQGRGDRSKGLPRQGMALSSFQANARQAALRHGARKWFAAHERSKPRRMGFDQVLEIGSADATHFPRELAESALAHVAGDATEQLIGAVMLSKATRD